MHEALSKLCTYTLDDGKLGIIRVVVAFPGKLRQEAVTTILEGDHKYPLATIDLDRIPLEYHDLQALLSLDQVRRVPL
jgi:hypothetical protein